MASSTSSKPSTTTTSSKSSSRVKSSSTTKPDWVPDPDFFYELHTFQVDSFRFRIPKQFLLASSFFRRLFHVDAPVGPVEQFCDVDYLEGVTAVEFRDLLRVLLPARSRAGVEPTSWVNVLKLATLWGFADLREVAIEHIGHCEDCVVRLAAARHYDAKQLLPQALEDVLERTEPLQLEEYNTLGLELAVDVVRYREAIYPRGGIGEVPPEQLKESLIEDIFGADFARDWEEGKAMETAEGEF